MGGGLPSLIVSTSKTNTCCVSKKEPLVLLEPMWCVGTHVCVCHDPVGHDSKRPNYIHACTSIYTQPKYMVGWAPTSLTPPTDPTWKMGFARRQLLDVQKLLEYRKHLVYDFSTCAGACTYCEKIKLAQMPTCGAARPS